MADYSSFFGQGGLNEHVDAEALCEEIGLDRDEIEWRKDFLDFDSEDVERLERFQELFEEEGETVAELFYENLTQYEETTEVIGRSPKGVEELKRTQEAYLVTLANGTYGPEYFEDRARIGKLHDILDMPMKQYIGQYGVYYNLLVPIVTERIQSQVSSIVSETMDGTATDGGVEAESRTDEVERPASSFDAETFERQVNEAIEAGIEELHSLLKIINLDMQVVADTYIHSYTREIETTLERQQKVAAEVTGAMGELSAASNTVANSASEISGLAEEQSENMGEVAGEVSNLSATVEEVASSAEGVARRSQTAAEMAEDGRERGEAVLDVMEDVTEASETVQHDVRGLQETVEEIDEIIDVINDIASQTNLLALNANIEAARAGEAGQGFAVVADEIKGLAEQSQEQAGEIEAMLEEIRESTTETVTSLDATRENIRSAADEVEASITMLEEIADAVEETVVGIEEVSEATDEQAASAEEIAAMVDGATEKAERVADEIEDVAASTEEQAASIDQVERSMDRLVDHRE